MFKETSQSFTGFNPFLNVYINALRKLADITGERHLDIICSAEVVFLYIIPIIKSISSIFL